MCMLENLGSLLPSFKFLAKFFASSRDWAVRDLSCDKRRVQEGAQNGSEHDRTAPGRAGNSSEPFQIVLRRLRINQKVSQKQNLGTYHTTVGKEGMQHYYGKRTVAQWHYVALLGAWGHGPMENKKDGMRGSKASPWTVGAAKEAAPEYPACWRRTSALERQSLVQPPVSAECNAEGWAQCGPCPSCQTCNLPEPG